MISVKNVGQGPQTVEGCGVLEHGQIGNAADTEHTQALVDAGHLLVMPDEPRLEVAEPEQTPTRPRARATAKED